MKNTKGLSLIELLVSLVVSSIVILMVGVLSSIANRSFNKLNKEQSIYSDISHGFRLLQYKVRSASSLTAGTTLSPWITNQYFLIDSAIFGICQYNFSTNSCDAAGTEKALVYKNGASSETILRVPPGTINLVITLSSPAPSKSVTVNVSGIKDAIPFNMQTMAARRNL